MKKLNGFIHLFRPELSMAAGICVVTGQILALGKLPSLTVGFLGFLSVFALSASALILNDYFDYEVDRINMPDRPLPSGAVSRGEVIALTVITTLVGLLSAWTFGVDVLVFSIMIWAVGFLYNWRFKQSGLIGNLMVCISVAATFIFGAMTVRALNNGPVWIFSLMAFFIDLGEEIAGDAMDMDGDKKRGSRSIALLKGKRFALTVSVVLWGVVVLLSLVPMVMGWLGLSYLIFILVTDGLIVFFSIRILKSQDSKSGRQAMRGIYLGATLAIVAFLIGQLIG